MGTPLFEVNAFTDRPFAGNPAGVCLLPGPAEPRWMQLVARELNVSETAFLYREGDRWRLRWFTPTVEVALCGHATLASAHVLWESGQLAPETPARFQTRSGLLTAERRGERIEMDFPAQPAAPAAAPPELVPALGITPRFVGRSAFDYLVEAETPAQLRALQPDLGRLRAVATRGVILTSPSDQPGYDFLSRFFCPAVGVNEDPVTGSAHCTLGPYWAEKLGRTELRGWQASARGGAVQVRVNGARVALNGQAVTVWRGELVSGARAGS